MFFRVWSRKAACSANSSPLACRAGVCSPERDRGHEEMRCYWLTSAEKGTVMSAIDGFAPETTYGKHARPGFPSYPRAHLLGDLTWLPPGHLVRSVPWLLLLSQPSPRQR